ncbi:McrB family protein [Pseudomonas sp. A-B-26]|uniref:McrB family protein n=1 Tax=Pseudomonas sp. A-B-26 TaxID=2832406 RepID=UPI001CC007D4|nr:hypothetical protein [Pseudomonas sp. A-B-26]
MKIDSDAVLNTHLQAILVGPAQAEHNLRWASALGKFLEDVKGAIPGRLANRDFLLHLWNSEAVSSTGNGHVNIEPALDDPEFVQWFATRFAQPLPTDPVEAQNYLINLYDELSRRMRALCTRNAWLKLNRVMCAFFPEQFTTIADKGRLYVLHRALGGDIHDHHVLKHLAIRARIDLVLGPVVPGEASVRRLCLPWLLYERLDKTNASETAEPVEPTKLGLTPMPAVLRRKGLTALGGGFATVLEMLDDLNQGVTREEFADLLRQFKPELRDNSVSTMINVIARELDICKREDGIYGLNARGLNLLETQDPDELADHLLTRVLGIDHVITQLKSGPCSKSHLVVMLQAINPGWTKADVPTAILSWLRNLGVIEPNSERMLLLTERGRRWGEMIAWEPQSLPQNTISVIEPVDPAELNNIVLPNFQDIVTRLGARAGRQMAFDAQLIWQLHAGLWSNPRRHFAVLTGISGSGKTQLALNYAHALCGSTLDQAPNIQVIPVQPGWYDPSPLLGYVSPLSDNIYRSAPFLEVLLQAAGSPLTPYVVILDEMNLSHPEQYLAPILSAMETGGYLDLHQLGNDIVHVPETLRYPANLAIIGTVNMDETTHGLSDKVLDRAYTLEFWKIDVDAFPGWQTTTLPADLRGQVREAIQSLVKALEPVRLHFGWRTISDVLGYLAFHHNAGLPTQNALDDVVYAKVLPKIRGEATPKFQTALGAVHDCLKTHGLERCAEKIASMKEDLLLTGSTRFWR